MPTAPHTGHRNCNLSIQTSISPSNGLVKHPRSHKFTMLNQERLGNLCLAEHKIKKYVYTSSRYGIYTISWEYFVFELTIIFSFAGVTIPSYTIMYKTSRNQNNLRLIQISIYYAGNSLNGVIWLVRYLGLMDNIHSG